MIGESIGEGGEGLIVEFVVAVGLGEGCTENQAAGSGESHMDRTHDICSIYRVYEYIPWTMRCCGPSASHDGKQSLSER